MKKMTMMFMRKKLRCLYRLPFLSISSKTVTAAPTRRRRRRRRKERRIIRTPRRRRRRRTTTSRTCSDSFTFDLLLNLFASSDFSFASLVGGRNPLAPAPSPSPPARSVFPDSGFRRYEQQDAAQVLLYSYLRQSAALLDAVQSNAVNSFCLQLEKP